MAEASQKKALLKFMVDAPLFALLDKSEFEGGNGGKILRAAGERNSEPASAGDLT